MSAMISCLCNAVGWGAETVHWASCCIGMSLESRRVSIAAGAILVAKEGVERCVQGKGAQGVAQAVLGAAVTACALTAAPKVLEIAYNASLVAFGSCCAIYSGLGDLTHKRMGRGAVKIGVGLCGLASSVHYARAAWMEKQEEELLDRLQPWNHQWNQESGPVGVHYETPPAEYMEFARKHGKKMAELRHFYFPGAYSKKEGAALLGEWQWLDAGGSKHAFTHPDLPGQVIKIGKHRDPHWKHGLDSDIRSHYINLQNVKAVHRSYPNIVLPESYLIETYSGPIAIEQRFSFVGSYTLNSSRLWELEKELWQFSTETGICELEIGKNAGILAGEKIGVYDLDCRQPLGLPGSE